MTGTPSVSVPIGYAAPKQGKGKVPVGLMATGDWGSEERLLAFAGEAEEYLHDVYNEGRRSVALRNSRRCDTSFLWNLV